MAIGLKRTVVELTNHDPKWEMIAAQTIERLWRIFGSAARDIQHIGSTAVKDIKAKPIIDIAVAVDSFDVVEKLTSALEQNGWSKSVLHAVEGDVLFVDGDEAADMRTHHIHIVIADSIQWKNYICFRDYLNAFPASAKEYDAVKQEFALQYPNDRNAYTSAKSPIVDAILRAARVWDDFGRDFTQIALIDKGWSEDKKYRVAAADGTKYLLRITPAERYEVRKSLFEMMRQVYAMGIPMCRPVDFGTCTDGVYSLQSWIDGEDLETALPLMSETEQYVLGLKSGEIARKMHGIPAPDAQEAWEQRFGRKTDVKIQKYHECGLRFDCDEHILAYIEQNRHLLEGRPQCFQHGDYHVGNMMIENGELMIIDFDCYDFGDPWEEFNRIVWSAAVSPHFATGQLRSYFGGEPPMEFFKLLAFYIASNTLSSIYWAIPFGQSDIDTMMKQSQDVLVWFNNMKNPVPTWYLKDFHIQWIDGVPYKLKAHFDFSFLSKYGKVFKVFDGQDSGNICFGVNSSDGRRCFVKFAGAPTEGYSGTAEDAIARLKPTVQIYRDLAHPMLIKLVSAEEIGGGFAVVFEWVDAVCTQRMYPQDYLRFQAIPLDTKIRIFEDIMDFHAHVAKCGYVAIDFYDGSIMYDLSNGRTVICDIDFYEKSPYVGSMGLWGSSRFVSPEERTDGAVLDEVTNVYTMGAAAFCLLANSDRTLEKWPLSEWLYDVAIRAVSDEREKRQQSIEQLIAEWDAAKKTGDIYSG
jgi:serine/threonine-protein kinase